VKYIRLYNHYKVGFFRLN